MKKKSDDKNFKKAIDALRILIEVYKVGIFLAEKINKKVIPIKVTDLEFILVSLEIYLDTDEKLEKLDEEFPDEKSEIREIKFPNLFSNLN